MSEIHYVERVPRRWDFCGCPPCPVCYDPVITDDQKAPIFEEVMKEIYGEGPKPQNEQEYEWAHVAAHHCREELKAGDFFATEDRARMTQMQIDDLLKRAKKARQAPKPLNTVNLDDMPMETVSKMTQKAQVKEDVDARKTEYSDADRYWANKAREADQQAMQQMQAMTNAQIQGYQQQQVSLSQPLQPVWFIEPATLGDASR